MPLPAAVFRLELRNKTGSCQKSQFFAIARNGRRDFFSVRWDPASFSYWLSALPSEACCPNFRTDRTVSTPPEFVALGCGRQKSGMFRSLHITQSVPANFRAGRGRREWLRQNWRDPANNQVDVWPHGNNRLHIHHGLSALARKIRVAEVRLDSCAGSFLHEYAGSVLSSIFGNSCNF